MSTSPRRPRPLVCLPLATLAFFLMTAGWAMALPANGTYDEKQHLVRAYAVASGQWLPEHTAEDTLGRVTEAFLAPRSLLPVGTSVDCTWWRPYQPASCQRWDRDRTRVPQPTVAAHYSPVYYAPVGLPLLTSPDRTGVVLARLVSGLLSALAFGGALTAAMLVRRRWLAAAVLLVATPSAVNLAGAVNPNGLEIAAGVLTGGTLLALLDPDAADLPVRHRRLLLWLLGLGALLLLTVRQLGPVLLVVLVAGCGLLVGWRRLVAVAGAPPARWILGGCLATGVAIAGGWLLWSGGAVPMAAHQLEHLSTGAWLRQLVTWRLPFSLKQMVAQFSYSETNVSPLVVVGWYLLLALLAGPGLVRVGRRGWLAVGWLTAASLGLLVAMDVRYFPRYGWFSQGRYVLAAAVGVVLCAAAAPALVGRSDAALAGRSDAVLAGRFGPGLVGRSGPAGGSAEGWRVQWWSVTDRRGGPVWLAAVTVPLHLVALTTVLARFQAGVGAPPDPFTGSWRPAVGSLPPLLCLLGGTILAVALVAAAQRPAGHPSVRSDAPRRQGAGDPATGSVPEGEPVDVDEV